MIVASFLAFLGAFLAIGLASAFRAKKDRKDYYLAGSSVPPWLAALSAVATNNSGYMFIGVIGYTYVAGFAAVWLMVGWLVGDFVASLFIHRKLREFTTATGEASFASVLASTADDPFAIWRRVAAVVMIVFLGAYAAAQIAAGGKALEGVLDWDPRMGAVVVAAMILSYSFAGGIRASIWTDAAQSFVMIGAMSTLFVVGVTGMGGVTGTLAKLGEIPNYLDVIPPDMILPGFAGVAAFFVGWFFAGFSVVGQPHVMVRFMALDNPDHMVRTRFWYYGYFTLFYCLATGVGMLSRLYLPELGDMDPELALPTMALDLLPPVLVGMILAGIFAATMSTADSLVLSCSAAVTHDFAPDRLEHPWMLKAATAGVTLLALVIAVTPASASVFSLVILAWGVLASAFAPLLTLFALNRRVKEPTALLMMGLGVGVALGWRWIGWHGAVYEGLPGILVPLVVGWVLSQPYHEAKRAEARAAAQAAGE